MTSWRDGATQQSQDDLDGLMRVTLPFAQQMLAKAGEFYPFGMIVTVDGDTEMFAADPGSGEHPASVEVRTFIFDGMRGSREKFRAIAVCLDVRLPDSDAIRVELEHRDGQALAVLLPYKKKRFGRDLDYQDLRGGHDRQDGLGVIPFRETLLGPGEAESEKGRRLMSEAFYSHARLYDLMFPGGGPAVDFYRAEAGRPGGQVLELGRGTGHKLIPIASDGYSCVGLDFSSDMLAEARRKADERGVVVEWLQGDMTAFDLGRTFDFVFITANSLLHLHEVDDLVSCFRSVRRHLAPGARFIFDVFNPSVRVLAEADGLRRTRESLSFTDPDRGRVKSRCRGDLRCACAGDARDVAPLDRLRARLCRRCHSRSGASSRRSCCC